MTINVPEIEQARARIVDTAQEMLAGRISYIEGTRAICGMLNAAGLDHLQDPFVGFTAIDCETDGVPIGDVRERWHPEARLKLAADWESAEIYAKSIGERTCRAAIAWLDANPLVGR